MPVVPDDIFTEQEADPNGLANLGPLARLAGIWESGHTGADVNPKAEGPEHRVYRERIEMHPIDPQANGPQLFYGLRYHVHIVRPGEVETFHDQVGYWLWEPATKTVIQMLAIPRAQVALAIGFAEPDARDFELIAGERGICSGPFIERAFRTVEFRIRIKIGPGDTWSYDEDTVLQIKDRAELFHHRDRNTLVRVAAPTPNPLAR